MDEAIIKYRKPDSQVQQVEVRRTRQAHNNLQTINKPRDTSLPLGIYIDYLA